MILPAVVILAYRRATDKDSGDLDWKEFLVKEVEELHRPLTAFSCTGIHNDVVGAPTSSFDSDIPSLELPDEDNERRMAANASSAVTGESSFSSVARKEWIHAVFGKSLQSPRGFGLAQIDEYTCSGIVIDASWEKESLGITLSRLTLGLYVRHVEPGSEAAVAGVLPQSVLVAVNDIPLLAEPSKQALERLWQYEGLFSEVSANAEFYTEDAALLDLAKTKENFIIQEPVRMSFIRNGYTYTVLLLSDPPYGIEWGPCGNFALVKRNEGTHEEISRGAIVGGVNENPIDDLDHTTSAKYIKEAIDVGMAIDLKLCWPPPTARSGHWERQQIAKQSNTPTGQGKRSEPLYTKQHDGIQVKVHSFFSQSKKMSSATQNRGSGTTLSQLANLVASGEVVNMRKVLTTQNIILSKLYLPCPKLDGRLMEGWKIQQALLFGLKYHWTMHMPREKEDTFIGHNRLSELLLDFPKSLFGGFLLPLLACSSSTASNMPHSGDHQLVYDEIIKLAKSKPSLAPTMELLAMSLDYGRMQADLRAIRIKVEAAVLPMVNYESDDVEKEENGYHTAPTQQTQPNLAQSKNGIVATDSTPAKSRFPIFRKMKKSSQKQLVPSISGASRATIPGSPALVNHNAPLSLLLEEQDKELEHGMNMQRMFGCREMLFSNTLTFIKELEVICEEVEKSLQKSFPQRLAGALQPWSPNKETALLQVTNSMRERLASCSNLQLLNPIDSNEMTVALDAEGCHILPSAHCPLLLTFDCQDIDETSKSHDIFGLEQTYETLVEVVRMKSSRRAQVKRSFVVHASVAGVIKESSVSFPAGQDPNVHVWKEGNAMAFETRSSWGAPQTLSLRLSEAFITTGDNNGLKGGSNSKNQILEDVGVCWVDLANIWEETWEDSKKERIVSVCARLLPSKVCSQFDQHGELPDVFEGNMEVSIKMTSKLVLPEHRNPSLAIRKMPSRRRSLLYKHSEDLRQEMFAIEFIKACDTILKSCGLDLKLITFRCISVGKNQGFLEWVHGSIPLSELSHAFTDSIFSSKKRSKSTVSESAYAEEGDDEDEHSSVALAGVSNYETLQRFNSDVGEGDNGKVPNNPIQDYLRSFAYDADAPYMIRKDVMDTYVKSCAGYCAITYVLGVGDRHLDNLLLHQTGHFFHCDFSYILGNDPKKYLPVRISEDMINGMGGRNSDTYIMFLSLTCAAFLTLRRPENVRYLLSLVRLMDGCSLPDVETKQTIEKAILGIRQRLRLDLTEDGAITFMEKLIEDSCSSKIWYAVDAIHTLGKRF
eukprot:scaffold871_cov130-Cylindrotheca_fusiformis.AAC.23